ASRYLRAPQKGTASRDDRPSTRGPAGVARYGGHMMHTHLTAFQTYLEVERQASPHTIRNHLSDLEQFVHFSSQRLGKAALTPAQIDAPLIRDFLSTLYQHGVGHTSLARKLASLRSFLHFLQQQGQVRDNVAKHVQAPKIRRPLPNVLPIDQVFALL